MYGNNGMQGFADLGKILATAGQPNQEQFTVGATKLAQMDEALSRARAARQKQMARESTRAKLIESGMDPNQANLLSNIMLGETGSDFNAGMSGLETQQQMGGRNEAMQLARDNKPDLMNLMIAAAQDKPLQTTVIDEGNVINPYGLPDQNVVSSPTGTAKIMADIALANQRGASAAQGDRKLDLVETLNDFNMDQARQGKPTTTRGGGKPKNGETGGDIDVPEDGSLPGGPLGGKPKMSKEEAMQALHDARKAISLGRITREEAKKRLREAGLAKTAERL